MEKGPLPAFGAKPGWHLAAVFEAPALVAGFDDFAMMGEAVEERGCHLGVAKHTGPIAKGQIGGDDDGSALVEPADQMKEQLAAGLSEGQIAEFVENDEVHAGEIFGEPPLPAGAGFEWVVDGPHIMLIIPNLAQLEGLPTDPKGKSPYVMWKGTPYAHIMVPVAEPVPSK